MNVNKTFLVKLFEFVICRGRGFLVNSKEFEGVCVHEWNLLDGGLACCSVCGSVHDCDEGKCITENGSSYGQVCNITGCIVRFHEFKEERNCYERTNCTGSGCNNIWCGDSETSSKRKWKYERGAHEGNEEIVVQKKRDKRRKLMNNFSLEEEGSTMNSACHDASSSSSIFFTNSLQHPKMVFCVLSVFDNNMNKFHDCIQETVTEILFSEKTRICFKEEMRRNDAKVLSVFSRLLKTSAHHCLCTRPNMVNILCELFHVHQKCRMLYFENENNKKEEILALVEKCVASISYLLLNFGGCRVARQMQNAARCREFICSMLFLMRMGVTYQKRQLLPKIDLLNDYLPMQVLLPNIFNIRAKSITEGENIIKLDIRKIPWI